MEFRGYLGRATRVSALIALSSCTATPDVKASPSLMVKEGLFDHNDHALLGLSWAPDAETVSIFTPSGEQNHYNHGVVLFPFQEKIFAMWQSSYKDEDAEDTAVFYAMSADGRDWSTPKSIRYEDPESYTTSGGWWSDGDTLVAYLNVWAKEKQALRHGNVVFLTSADGDSWSDPKPLLDAEGNPVLGVIEQDLRTIKNDRVVTAFHVQPGLNINPYFTDDPLGIHGWTPGQFQRLPSDSEVSREIEPSQFVRDDGALVMIFRDQTSTYKTLVSVSHDLGESWTVPELVDFPDSRSKQSAGNFPDGTVFRVNNPRNDKSRFPLVVSTSKDGITFDCAWVLRAGGEDMQPLRKEGRYKRPSYSYPKSVVIGEYLYVGYTTNKEDVQLTRVPWYNLSVRPDGQCLR